jgi:hypothetical protein
MLQGNAQSGLEQSMYLNILTIHFLRHRLSLGVRLSKQAHLIMNLLGKAVYHLESWAKVSFPLLRIVI